MERRAAADERHGARKRRRVLILAYYFPPLGGGGVQRTLKHVKFLPAAGFEPIVVTVRPLLQPLKDPSLEAEVPPQAVVLRAPELPVYAARWALASLLKRARLPTAPADVVGWPDEFVGWAPAALFYSLAAVRRYRPDVIYSTSSPVSAHAVALIASRLTGLPWVADFRDAWTHNPQGPPLLAGLSTGLERRIVRSASRLVVADSTVELVGVAASDPRRIIIHNGVDPDDLLPLTAASARPHLRIAHIGSLYGSIDAAPVIAALRNLIGRGAIDREKIELRIVGHGRLAPGLDTEGLPLSQSGYVDHRRALAEMAASDVLLLYLPPGWQQTTGKIYEYLATGHPILCVAPEDNLGSQLVAELGAGIRAAPDDQPAIEEALERLYLAWSAGTLGPSERVREEALRRFSRPELARQLAQVLDDACRDAQDRTARR